jgi:hypothetical protein
MSRFGKLACAVPYVAEVAPPRHHHRRHRRIGRRLPPDLLPLLLVERRRLFLGLFEEFGRALHARLTPRPANEDPATALRDAFTVNTGSDTDRAFELAKTTMGTPALHARYLEHLSLWRPDLAVQLARRSGIDHDTNARPTLAAAIALATFDTALIRWVNSGEATEVNAKLDDCFAHVADTLNSLLNPTRRRTLRAAADGKP